MAFRVGAGLERLCGPTCSVCLDRVVRSVSASEQSDESGAYSSIRRPQGPSMPRPDSRPGIRHQPSNSANHCPTAPGPHRGSRGTYGVVPRPEGSGEDGVLPGKQGVFGGRSPPLMREHSARSQPRQRTLCFVGGAYDLCGVETPEGGGPFTKGPPPSASPPPPPEGGGLLRFGLALAWSGFVGPRVRSVSTESFGARAIANKATNLVPTHRFVVPRAHRCPDPTAGLGSGTSRRTLRTIVRRHRARIGGPGGRTE